MSSEPHETPQQIPVLPAERAQQFHDVLLRLDRALAELVSEHPLPVMNLSEMRHICTHVVSRATGMNRALSCISDGGAITSNRAIQVRQALHAGFGHRTTWTAGIRAALIELDKLDLRPEREAATSTVSDRQALYTGDLKHEVFDAMERLGGGFVQHLAAVWRRADRTNFYKLLDAFLAYWLEYEAIALRERDRRAGSADAQRAFGAGQSDGQTGGDSGDGGGSGGQQS